MGCSTSFPFDPTQDIGLKGKLAVVTGSTKGIGFAIAREYARHGVHVVVTGRKASDAEDAKKRIVAETGAAADTLFAFGADLSTKPGVDSLIEQIDALKIPVDILVNNSGAFAFNNFFEESDADWQRFYDVNVLSGVRLTRYYLKGMLERKWGRVIFSSSVVAAVPSPSATAYSISKLSQVGLSRALSELTKGTEVTVNSVLIGPTASDGMSAFVSAGAKAAGVEEEDFTKGLLGQIAPGFYALDRLETAEEVANIFLFLSSKQGLLVNGAAQSAAAGMIRHVL